MRCLFCVFCSVFAFSVLVGLYTTAYCKTARMITGALQQEASRLEAELQALSDAKAVGESDASAAVAEKAARLAEAMETLRSLEAAAQESKEAIAALELQASC